MYSLPAIRRLGNDTSSQSALPQSAVPVLAVALVLVLVDDVTLAASDDVPVVPVVPMVLLVPPVVVSTPHSQIASLVATLGHADPLEKRYLRSEPENASLIANSVT